MRPRRFSLLSELGVDVEGNEIARPARLAAARVYVKEELLVKHLRSSGLIATIHPQSVECTARGIVPCHAMPCHAIRLTVAGRTRQLYIASAGGLLSGISIRVLL